MGNVASVTNEQSGASVVMSDVPWAGERGLASTTACFWALLRAARSAYPQGNLGPKRPRCMLCGQGIGDSPVLAVGPGRRAR